VVRRRALRYAREELGWMWRAGHRRWIPYTMVYEGAKFLGLQLGARHRRLPRWLKLRMTALPAYWQRAGGA
jgi:rhamnosyltransferase